MLELLLLPLQIVLGERAINAMSEMNSKQPYKVGSSARMLCESGFYFIHLLKGTNMQHSGHIGKSISN